MPRSTSPLILLALVGAVLAGCAEPGAGDADDGPQPASHSGGDGGDRPPAGTDTPGNETPSGPLPPTGPTAPALPQNVTSFVWDATGDIPMSTRFVFALSGPASDCSDEWRIAPPASDDEAAFFARGDSSSGGEATGVVLQGMEFEAGTEGSQGAGGPSASDGVAQYLLATDHGTSSGAWSIFFLLRCDAPFSIVAAEQARTVAIVDTLSLGGNGASVPLVVAANAGGRLDVDTTLPTTVFLSAAGAGVGSWSVSGPLGRDNSYGAGPGDTFERIDGPAGAWSVEAEFAKVYGRGAFAAVVEGWQDFVP